MSVVNDLRGVLQDLVVPDLKSLQQRVDSLENRMNERFDDVNRRFDDVNRRFDEVRADAERRHAELLGYLALDARVRTIEAEQAHRRRSEAEQAHESRT
jgi:hypothetical protein